MTGAQCAVTPARLSLTPGPVTLRRVPAPASKLTVDEAFGLVLAELRLEAGLSQERLGNESGSGRTFISELERARRGASLKTLFRLAPHLGVQPAQIVARVEELLEGGRR